MHILNVFCKYLSKKSVHTCSSLYISFHLLHDRTFCICSGILLYRWKGEKKICQFSFQPFYISCGYITFPSGSKKEVVFFAFFLSAAHFIFNVWASHLSLTQWSGTLLPWQFESIQNRFLKKCLCLPIIPEPDFNQKCGDIPSI